MSKHNFNKIKNRWYIDLPLWLGPSSSLEMIWGADDLLNRISDGSNKVTLELSTRKFKGYDDVLDRVAKMTELTDEDGSNAGYGRFDGAVYEVRNKHIKNKIVTENNLWLCGVTLFVFLRYPKHIYFKKIKEHEKFHNNISCVTFKYGMLQSIT